MQRLDGQLTAHRPATFSARRRRLVRAGLSATAVAFAFSPFGGLAVAGAEYNDNDFAACMNRNMPTDYCCEHAGGVIRNGACVDPATLNQAQTSGVLEVPPTNGAPIVIAVRPSTAALP